MSKKAIVLDANILIRAVLGSRAKHHYRERKVGPVFYARRGF